MPLLFSVHPTPNSSFGLWQIAESETFFKKELPLSQEEKMEISLFKGIRRQEWLAGRWLLHQLSGSAQRMSLGKDTFSKPFFLDRPDKHCSLSHSHGIVGALLADNICGCDVQVMVEKMPRLAAKFVNLREAEFIDTFHPVEQFDLFHIVWTAKETLYKAYGLKELDFKSHLSIDPFEWNGHSGQTTGWVKKGLFRRAYRLFFEKYTISPDLQLVWTVGFETAF